LICQFSLHPFPTRRSSDLGGGPIGLLYLQVFRAAGARKVILVEPQPGRADFARGFGADLVLDPNRDDLATLVREQTEIGADVVRSEEHTSELQSRGQLVCR